jgi:hypothetical protein
MHIFVTVGFNSFQSVTEFSFYNEIEDTEKKK